MVSWRTSELSPLVGVRRGQPRGLGSMGGAGGLKGAEPRKRGGGGRCPWMSFGEDNGQLRGGGRQGRRGPGIQGGRVQGPLGEGHGARSLWHWGRRGRGRGRGRGRAGPGWGLHLLGLGACGGPGGGTARVWVGRGGRGRALKPREEEGAAVGGAGCLRSSRWSCPRPAGTDTKEISTNGKASEMSREQAGAGARQT